MHLIAFNKDGEAHLAMSTAMLRLRHVQALADIPADERLVRVPSGRNEVWVGENLVVRIASNVRSRRLSHEVQALALLPPEVPHPGVIRNGRAPFGEWAVLPRVRHAAPLAHVWPDLDDTERFTAISSIAGALQAVHSTDASQLDPSFMSAGSLECAHQLPQSRLLPLIDRLRAGQRVDRGLLLDAENLAHRADAILGPLPSTMVHGDFHLENVLFGRGLVRAVIDFEFARAGWPEIDLEILLRFCDAPHLHVSSAHASRLQRDDFRPVVTWLREGYPALFERPDLAERVNVCSLSYDLRDLAMFPPDRPANELPLFHPVNRLARLLDGRGLLQLIEW